MDDAQFGTRVRAVRVKQRKRQVDVAIAARVRVDDVVYVEKGRLDALAMGVIRRVLGALDMSLELRPKWQGVELDQQMGGAHDALQAAVVAFFDRLEDWVVVPEVTYAIFGDRGAIDILGWHARTRTLLIIELKTLLVDAGEVVRKSDERTRRASEIASERGWHPKSIARWLIFTDTTTNRRSVRRHEPILRPLSELDGRAMHLWLRRPTGPVSALSFWTAPSAKIQRRIRLTKGERQALAAKAEEVAAAAKRDAARAERVAQGHSVARRS
jgi:hypothetical protein